MTTATPTKTDTDTETAVEAAFEELDCCSQRKDHMPCGGTIRGFQEHHDCVVGWLCQVHWDNAIMVVLPQHKKDFAEKGYIQCLHCSHRFDSVTKMVRFFPV